MDRPKAIVLFSGGLDSTVTLWWVIEKGWNAVPLIFNYFRRPEAEERAVKNILEGVDISHQINVSLEFLKEVEDLNKDGIFNPELKDAPGSYIPSRNMIFYSIAAYYAEVLDARYLVGGHNKEDPHQFPDSGPSFFKRMNALIEAGTPGKKRTRCEIILPLSEKTKDEIILLGFKLKAPVELTWSCNIDGKTPCGSCSSCIERRNAFVKISTLYPDVPARNLV